MSRQGIEFLDQWMARNLPRPGDAFKLASLCAGAAEMAGISWSEIVDEVGPMEAFFASVLAHPANDVRA